MREQILKDLLAQICGEMLDRLRDRDLYSGGDFDRGWVSGAYSMMKIVDTELKLSMVDLAEVGWDDFDVDEWLRLGAAYWDSARSN